MDESILLAPGKFCPRSNQSGNKHLPPDVMWVPAYWRYVIRGFFFLWNAKPNHLWKMCLCIDFSHEMQLKYSECPTREAETPKSNAT